jgi:hypothetical protein
MKGFSRKITEHNVKQIKGQITRENQLSLNKLVEVEGLRGKYINQCFHRLEEPYVTIELYEITDNAEIYCKPVRKSTIFNKLEIPIKGRYAIPIKSREDAYKKL